MPWIKPVGFVLKEMPTPTLDESRHPEDSENVLVKVIYAGFCGSDRGIWNRAAFKGMIFDSLKRENNTTPHHRPRDGGRDRGGGLKGHPPVRLPGQGHRVHREPHHLRHLLPVPDRPDPHLPARDVIIGIGRDGCFAEYIKLPANVLWGPPISARSR